MSDPYQLTLGPNGTGHHFDYWRDSDAANGKPMTSAEYAAAWLTHLAQQAQAGQQIDTKSQPTQADVQAAYKTVQDSKAADSKAATTTSPAATTTQPAPTTATPTTTGTTTTTTTPAPATTTTTTTVAPAEPPAHTQVAAPVETTAPPTTQPTTTQPTTTQPTTTSAAPTTTATK
jgi:hypothetical protein